ncbi:MAG TPA: Sterol-binding domain protein [Gammaproteobacteria bacterium]|nr:Sterol-binding domain protein [Gammaproteobacteria bacterium]
MDFAQIFSAGLESALNRYISLDPDALSRFSAIEGKVIAIEIQGLNQTISLFPSADGVMVLSDFDAEADATISATPVALAKLGLSSDTKDLLFSGEVSVTGDVGLANQFNRLLSQLDIDWEELLAQHIGDIAAHKFTNVLKDVGGWMTRSKHSFSMDAGEYLQEEARLSPSNAELRQFVNRVDELRESVDRLAARVQQLKSHKDRH